MRTNLFSCHGYSGLYIQGRWVKAGIGVKEMNAGSCYFLTFMLSLFDCSPVTSTGIFFIWLICSASFMRLP